MKPEPARSDKSRIEKIYRILRINTKVGMIIQKTLLVQTAAVLGFTTNIQQERISV